MNNRFRVLVCGGRDFQDYPFLVNTLNTIQCQRGQFACIIHGAQRGADTLAGQYAERHNIQVLRFPADWKRYGKKRAGGIRNAQMLREAKPVLVIAFPGGVGTRNMISQARAANIEVLEY